jgi:hypothetical protein
VTPDAAPATGDAVAALRDVMDRLGIEPAGFELEASVDRLTSRRSRFFTILLSGTRGSLGAPCRAMSGVEVDWPGRVS